MNEKDIFYGRYEGLKPNAICIDLNLSHELPKKYDADGRNCHWKRHSPAIWQNT
jgi:hypothetical protein